MPFFFPVVVLYQVRFDAVYLYTAAGDVCRKVLDGGLYTTRHYTDRSHLYTTQQRILV